MKPFALACAVLLMAGCGSVPTSQTKPEPPPQDDQLAKDLETIRIGNDFTHRYDQFTIDAYKVIADCRDVSARRWEENHCDARKKGLHIQKAKIDKEYAEWTAKR